MRVPTYAVALIGCLAVVAGSVVLLTDPDRPSAAAYAPMASTTASTTVCADVLLAGMTGSGEGSSTTALFGRSLEPFRRTYARAALASGRTLQQRYLGRPTATATTLKRSPGAGGAASKVVTATTEQRWEGDLSSDATRIVGALRDAAASCPRQQIVLVGYAQGAMAMHRALLRLVKYPGIFRRIVAATLISDGDRVPGTRAVRSGAQIALKTAKGVHPWFRPAMADVPQTTWTVPVWSVCERHDVACDLSSAPISAAIAAHRSYLSGDPAAAVRTVAGRVWARTTRWAYPVHGLTSDGSLGVATDSRLPVLVEPTDRDTTVFANATNLPPGMRLESDGRLTGTPTATGQWQVGYTVSNTVSAVFDRQVPGTVDVQVTNPAPRSVSAGGEHSCAVRSEGGAWCWGRNTYGQIGNGTTGPGPKTPTRVGTSDDWHAIAAGGASTCGIRANGTLWCWGLNHRGQLGDGTTKSKSSPIRVGTASNWASVSAGWFDTCGVRTDGSLWCWGDNSAGQIGDGTTTRRLVPTRLSGSEWTSVDVGGWHVCATRSDGTRRLVHEPAPPDPGREPHRLDPGGDVVGQQLRRTPGWPAALLGPQRPRPGGRRHHEDPAHPQPGRRRPDRSAGGGRRRLGVRGRRERRRLVLGLGRLRQPRHRLADLERGAEAARGDLPVRQRRLDAPVWRDRGRPGGVLGQQRARPDRRRHHRRPAVADAGVVREMTR